MNDDEKREVLFNNINYRQSLFNVYIEYLKSHKEHLKRDLEDTEKFINGLGFLSNERISHLGIIILLLNTVRELEGLPIDSFYFDISNDRLFQVIKDMSVHFEPYREDDFMRLTLEPFDIAIEKARKDKEMTDKIDKELAESENG